MKFKFSLNQKTFLYIFYGIIAVLFVIKLIFPQTTREKNEIQPRQNVTAEKANDSIYAQSLVVDSIMSMPHKHIAFEYHANGKPKHHRIYSVPDFVNTFPDPNPVHLATAMRLGVQPVKDRAQAEANKKELVFVASTQLLCKETLQFHSLSCASRCNIARTYWQNFPRFACR